MHVIQWIVGIATLVCLLSLAMGFLLAMLDCKADLEWNHKDESKAVRDALRELELKLLDRNLKKLNSKGAA